MDSIKQITERKNTLTVYKASKGLIAIYNGQATYTDQQEQDSNLKR